MTFSTQFLAQLRRDLAEWWPLWAAAVFAGLVPVLLPSLYSAEGEEALDLRVAALVVGGGLYWLASLILLGDGLAARDLAEGRLAFFVSRPLSAHAFWLARVSAALLLMAAITASLVLPTWIVGPETTSQATSREPAMDPWTMSVTAPGMELKNTGGPFFVGEGTLRGLKALAPLGVLGVLLSVLLLAHLAGVAGRSRDAWTLLDFGGLLIVALVALAARDVLLSAHAFGALVAAERLFVAAMAASLFVAGLRQLLHGRVDPARGHGVFSRTAWPLLALASVALLGAARWVASPSADDLRSSDFVVATPSGRAALVTGRAAHRLGLRTAVIFSEDGESLVVGPVSAVATSDRAASNRSERIVWTQCRRLIHLDCEVNLWSSESQEARATGIFSDRWDQQMALASRGDGELLALVDDKLEVWELAAGADIVTSRLVYALDLPESYPKWPAFLSISPSTIRLRFLAVDPEDETTPVLEVDLTSRTVRTLGELPGEAPIHLVTSPSGRFVFSASMMPGRLAVLDTETAEVYELQDEPLLSADAHVSPSFVDDRTLYLLAVSSGPWRLVRVDLGTLSTDAAGDAAPVLTEVELPPIRSRSTARLGVRGGSLLLSGESDEALGIGGVLDLPDGVEALPDRGLWRLDEGAWHLLATGVQILYERPSPAPRHDTSTLAGGGGAVLRLGDDGLHLVVPALPDTGAGRP